MTLVLMIITAIFTVCTVYFSSVFTFIVETYKASKKRQPKLGYLALDWWSRVLLHVSELVLTAINFYLVYKLLTLVGVTWPALEFWFNTLLPYVAGGSVVVFIFCFWLYRQFYQMKQWLFFILDDIRDVYVQEPAAVFQSYIMSFIISVFFWRQKLFGGTISPQAINSTALRHLAYWVHACVFVHMIGLGGYFWPGAILYTYMAFYRNAFDDE